MILWNTLCRNLCLLEIFQQRCLKKKEKNVPAAMEDKRSRWLPAESVESWGNGNFSEELVNVFITTLFLPCHLKYISPRWSIWRCQPLFTAIIQSGPDQYVTFTFYLSSNGRICHIVRLHSGTRFLQMTILTWRILFACLNKHHRLHFHIAKPIFICSRSSSKASCPSLTVVR